MLFLPNRDLIKIQYIINPEKWLQLWRQTLSLSICFPKELKEETDSVSDQPEYGTMAA
jgi:hypothetical protein